MIEPPTAALRHAATVTLGKMLQSEPRLMSDVEAPYLRAANVQPDGELRVSDVKTMWFGAQELRALDIRRGDVVVVEGGVGGFGRAAFVDRDLTGWGYQNSINRLRPRPGVDGRYVAYALLWRRASGWIRAYCNIVSMPHLTADKLGALPIQLPSSQQQRAIADYLDRETAHIDELIAEQQALIASLSERRQSLITRELVILTDSEGERRLKHYVTSVEQGWSPQCEAVPADGITEWGVLKAGCVNRGVFRAEDNKRLPDDLEPRPETVVREGQVIVGRANTRDLVGSAAVVDAAYPRLMLSDKLYAITLDPARVVPRIVALLLSTRRYRDLIQIEACGASYSMQNISQADILNLPLGLPALTQQRSTLDRIDRQTANIDQLTVECRDLIGLLTERRAALITAAVTGKIDVRDQAG